MTRRRLAAFLRALADRIAPPEPEPEVVSYADFVQRLKDERDAEIEREQKQLAYYLRLIK